MLRYVVALLAILTISDGSAVLAAARPVHHRATARHRSAAVAKRHKVLHAAGWAGAGAAAGHVAGPAGSAAVGAAKYRRDLKRNWHTRKRAMVKIGAPIAAGAVAGPAGSAAYAGFEHRRWIKRHLAPHRRHQVRRRRAVHRR